MAFPVCLKINNLTGVMIELTTYRLWDWRAANYAGEAMYSAEFAPIMKTVGGTLCHFEIL